MQMHKRKAHHFLSLTLLALALGNWPSRPFAAENESDQEKAAREESELQGAQAGMARAFAEYYKALKKDPKANKDALQSQIFAPAQDRMANLLSKRREETDKMIFDKAYFADGTIMDAEKFERDPRFAKYDQEDPDDRSPASADDDKADKEEDGAETDEGEDNSKTGKKASVEKVDSSAHAGRGNYTSSKTEAYKRPEWVLDGTNIPKEIVFPGKESEEGSEKSSAPSAQPKRKKLRK